MRWSRMRGTTVAKSSVGRTRYPLGSRLKTLDVTSVRMGSWPSQLLNWFRSPCTVERGGSQSSTWDSRQSKSKKLLIIWPSYFSSMNVFLLSLFQPKLGFEYFELTMFVILYVYLLMNTNKRCKWFLFHWRTVNHTYLKVHMHMIACYSKAK